MKFFNVIFLLGASATVLAACTATQEQFDFSKKAPDEFAIVTREPLEMPASLNQLPLPRPGMQRPQESAPEVQAQATLFGEADSKVIPNLTSGETILLQKANADGARSNIRDVVDVETQKVEKESTSTFNKILGRAGKKIDAPATVVDPVKESERIMQNKKAGKPVTEGETPSIEQ